MDRRLGWRAAGGRRRRDCGRIDADWRGTLTRRKHCHLATASGETRQTETRRVGSLTAQAPPPGNAAHTNRARVSTRRRRPDLPGRGLRPPPPPGPGAIEEAPRDHSRLVATSRTRQHQQQRRRRRSIVGCDRCTPPGSNTRAGVPGSRTGGRFWINASGGGPPTCRRRRAALTVQLGGGGELREGSICHGRRWRRAVCTDRAQTFRQPPGDSPETRPSCLETGQQ